MHSDKYDFHEKAVNAHDEGSWTVLLAFPWDSLPVKEGRFNAEFARHKSAVPPNTPNRSAFWSPPYGSARDSADNYGTIYRWPAVLQQECFGQGKSTKIVDDPAAADGKAMRVAAHVPWKLKCPVPQSFPADKVRIILRYRVESDPAQYVAFNIYEPKTKQTILKHKEPFEKVVGKEYHDVVLGEAVLKTGMVIHVGGIYADPKNYLKSNQNVHYLDFVRFELAQ